MTTRHPPAEATVLQGFEAMVAAGLRLVTEAGRIAVLNSGPTLDEFVPPLLAAARGVVQRGGSIRVLSLGPMSAEVARELAEAGADVRELAEAREVALMVTDHALILHPMDAGPLDPLASSALLVTGVVPVLRFQLAFEAAWARGKPALARHGKIPHVRRRK